MDGNLETALGALKYEYEQNKEMEAEIKRQRLEIEANILALVGHNENINGSTRYADNHGKKIEVKQESSIKIDDVKLFEIARQYELTGHISRLFNQKYTVNKTAWKNTAPELVAPLWGAITTKPSKPSIKIIKQKGNK